MLRKGLYVTDEKKYKVEVALPTNFDFSQLKLERQGSSVILDSELFENIAADTVINGQTLKGTHTLTEEAVNALLVGIYQLHLNNNGTPDLVMESLLAESETTH